MRTHHKKFLLIFILGVGLLTGFGLYRHVSSEAAPPLDWLGLQPTVEKERDLASAPTYSDLYSNRDCTKTSIPVYRSLTQKPIESYCFVSTGMGLMHYEGSIIQPSGYSEGFQLSKYYSNRPVLPVPNGVAAIQVTSSETLGVNLAVYKNYFQHLKIESGTNFAPQFRAIDPAEEQFMYSNGTLVNFNTSTLSFSQGGRFFIVDTVNSGFVKVDLLNLNKGSFASSLPRNSNGGLQSAATAIDNSGKFAAIAYGVGSGAFFKVVDMSNCTLDLIMNSSFSCPNVNLRAKLESSIPNLSEIRNVRFANERTITFDASTTSPTGLKYGRYSMTAKGQKKSLLAYLGVGDSYISGEGAYNYRAGTDIERNRCHQSTLSYPYLLGSGVSSYASVACSGAKSYNVVAVSGKPAHQIRVDEVSNEENLTALDSRLPGVVQQREFVDKDNPDAVTVSIGGNDIGFADIITRCVNPFQNVAQNIATHHTCYSTYEDRLELVNLINRQFDKLKTLYKSMRDGGAAGQRRVYVIGYPQVAKVGGDCGLNVQLNAQELVFARDLIDHLDSVIKRAADAAGVLYVDTQHAFDGKRLCEGDGSQSAMNGVTLGKRPWSSIVMSESFHPNKTGHELLANVIAAQTDSLTKPMPVPTDSQSSTTVDPNTAVLKDAPRTNRVVRHVQPLGEDLQIAQKGSALPVKVSAATFFTKPNTSYQIAIGHNSQVIGTVMSDAKGDIDASSIIPNDVNPGFLTLHVYGNDIFGNPIDLQRNIYTFNDPEDYDGDGVANAVDSCVIVGQSGIDKDADNIDDACDPVVTAPPATPSSEEGIIWRDDAILAIEIHGISGQ